MGSNPVGVTRRKQSALLWWLFCFDAVSGFEYGAAEQFPHFCGDCGALCAAQRKQSEKPGVAFQRVGRTGGNPAGVTRRKQSALLCWLFCFGAVSGFEYGAAER